MWSLLSIRSMVTLAVEQQFVGFPVSLAMICRTEKECLPWVPKHEKEMCHAPAQLPCTKQAARAKPCSPLASEPCRRRAVSLL